jgi:hypothetical protein
VITLLKQKLTALLTTLTNALTSLKQKLTSLFGGEMMPSTSKKQHNFMAAVAHNPAFAKKAGVPQSVGKDFSKADKGRKFSKGGGLAKFEKSGKDMEKGMKEGSKKDMMMDRMQMGMKRGGATKKMAGGGLAAGHKSADGIAQRGKTKGKEVAMKRGGKC